MIQDVQILYGQLRKVRGRTGFHEKAPRSAQSIDEVMNALNEEFDLQGQGVRGRKRLSEQHADPHRINVLLQRRLSYQVERRASEQNHDVSGAKLAGRIHNIWFLRAGLAPPLIPPASLASLCRDFNVHGIRQ